MTSMTRFGGQVPEELDEQLVSAAQHYTNKPRAESLLLDALKLNPQCLPTYFALYKFYFYSNRLREAEAIVQTALAVAAEQTGIGADWRVHTAQSAPWHDTNSPAHFYLFSLKALAFIRLRLHRLDEADELLDKLIELDASDTIGASVVRSLASAVASPA